MRLKRQMNSKSGSITNFPTTVLTVVSAYVLALMLVTLTIPVRAEGLLDLIKSKLGLSPYPVLESGYWVSVPPMGFHRLNWLDNDRVLFVGGSLKTWSRDKPNTPALFLWDTRTNTVTKLSDTGGYCFKPDEIRFAVKQTTDAIVSRIIKRGKEIQGTEVTRSLAEIEAESVKYRDQGFENHPLYCGGYSPRILAGENWNKYQLRQIFPLLDGHGYLDLFGWQSWEKKIPVDTDPARWFPPNGDEPIKLPMPKRAIDRHRINYSEWNSSYLLYGDQAPPGYNNVTGVWPIGVSQSIWLLHAPDGKVERQELPYAKWSRGLGHVLSTRAGFVVTRNDGTPDQGLYLVEGMEYVRVIGEGGEVGIEGIAPNGCKVAAAITSTRNEKERGLKMVNVCEKGGK